VFQPQLLPAVVGSPPPAPLGGTVDCIPLIASSIMSKKRVEGIDALVLDMKVGSGAFMKKVEDARTSARRKRRAFQQGAAPAGGLHTGRGRGERTRTHRWSTSATIWWRSETWA